MKKIAKKMGLLNESIGVNQIVPLHYPEFWELYKNGQNNNWVPTEVPMQKDIDQWKTGKLTKDEMLLVSRCIGFFAGGESLVNNNLLLSVFKWVTNAEARQYIVRQAYEEALHNETIVYICDSLGLDVNEVGEAYEAIPSIKDKTKFLMESTTDMNRHDFNTLTVEGKREFLRNLFVFYVVCEGIFFYSGFAMLLSLGRQSKVSGISEQIQYTLRDETIHIQFGTLLINKIREENPDVWNEDLEKEVIDLIDKAIELEIQYAEDVLPRGIIGLNADMFKDYVCYIANRRLENLNIKHEYETKGNPFPWMTEMLDLDKQKNFFETKVTNYQTGALDDDF
jgi:ribonucleoside-diphosphate reductase beta chain